MTRNRDEIQLAHDILDALIHSEICVGQDTADIERARQLRTVLCWVLMHREGREFTETIRQIHEKAVAAGYRLTPLPAAACGRG